MPRAFGEQNEVGLERGAEEVVNVLPLNDLAPICSGKCFVNYVALTKAHIVVAKQNGTEKMLKWLPHRFRVVGAACLYIVHKCIMDGMPSAVAV